MQIPIHVWGDENSYCSLVLLRTSQAGYSLLVNEENCWELLYRTCPYSDRQMGTV